MKKENYKRNIEVFDGIASYMSIKISRLCVQRKRESEKRACFKSVTVVNCDFTLWVTSSLNGLKIDIKPINPAIRIFHHYKISHLSIYLFILKQNEAQTLRYCFMLNLLIYCQLFFLMISYFLDEMPKTRGNLFISHEYSTSVKTQSDVFICKYVEQIKNWKRINIDF